MIMEKFGWILWWVVVGIYAYVLYIYADQIVEYIYILSGTLNNLIGVK